MKSHDPDRPGPSAAAGESRTRGHGLRRLRLFGISVVVLVVLGWILYDEQHRAPLRAGLVRFDTARGESSAFAPGDAFGVSLDPPRDGWVVVASVASDGAVALLEPAAGAAGAVRLATGAPVVLPDPRSGRIWRLGAGAGADRVIVALLDRDPGAADPLEARLRAAASMAGAEDGAGRAAKVAAALESLGGSVEILEVEHADHPR